GPGPGGARQHAHARRRRPATRQATGPAHLRGAARHRPPPSRWSFRLVWDASARSVRCPRASRGAGGRVSPNSPVSPKGVIASPFTLAARWTCKLARAARSASRAVISWCQTVAVRSRITDSRQARLVWYFLFGGDVRGVMREVAELLGTSPSCRVAFEDRSREGPRGQTAAVLRYSGSRRGDAPHLGGLVANAT